MGIEITGWGKCIPPVALTNKDLESFWIPMMNGLPLEQG